MSTSDYLAKRATLAEQEALADIRRTHTPGRASAATLASIEDRGWITVDRGTRVGSLTLTDLGDEVLDAAARR